MEEYNEKKKFVTGRKRKNLPSEVCMGYVSTLKKMVGCETVFIRDGSNQAEFDRFYKVLAECFPE